MMIKARSETAATKPAFRLGASRLHGRSRSRADQGCCCVLAHLVFISSVETFLKALSHSARG